MREMEGAVQIQAVQKTEREIFLFAASKLPRAIYPFVQISIAVRRWLRLWVILLVLRQGHILAGKREGEIVWVVRFASHRDRKCATTTIAFFLLVSWCKPKKVTAEIAEGEARGSVSRFCIEIVCCVVSPRDGKCATPPIAVFVQFCCALWATSYISGR